VDSATGASVEFLDSDTNGFEHHFKITLNDATTSQSVICNGSTACGDHSLTVSTDGAIVLFSGAALSVNNGNLRLTTVNGGDGSAVKVGISLTDASITTTGSGNIILAGTGATNAAESNNLDGISLKSNSRIASASTAADAGPITLTGNSGVGRHFSSGIYVDDFGGWPVRGRGNVNGDGYNDIIHAAVGGDSVANQRADAGETYIIWGGPSLPPEIYADNLGDAGITIFGADVGDNSGWRAPRIRYQLE